MKSAELNGINWDERQLFVLFAYRASIQELTKESPFYLLYGQNPLLLTEEMLKPRVDHDLEDYRSEMVKHLSAARKLVEENVKYAQKSQKKHYNKAV